MFLADYHTHTNYSPDSNVTIKDRVEWAINNGINEICLTDHLEATTWDTNVEENDLPPVNSKNKYWVRDYKKYYKEIEEVRELFKNKIVVKYGLELGFATDCQDFAKEIVTANNFDFVIGSVHTVKDEDLYPNTPYFSNRDKLTAFNTYFEEVLKHVSKYESFDVLGHMDYIYRYSKYPNNQLNYIDHKELIDEILKVLIENGKGIEINLSGIRYGTNTFYPSIDILQSYKNKGGEIITIGSDTHAKQDVKHLIIQAQEQLKQVGFDYVTTFEQRKPIFNKI